METQNVHERCQPLTSFHKTKSSLSCSSSFRISLACQAAKHLNSPSGLKDLIVCPFVTQRPMQPLKHIFICQHQHQMAAAGLSTFSSHAMPHPAPQRAANKDLRSHSSTSEASEVQCSRQHQTMVIDHRQNSQRPNGQTGTQSHWPNGLNPQQSKDATLLICSTIFPHPLLASCLCPLLQNPLLLGSRDVDWKLLLIDLAKLGFISLHIADEILL